MALLSLLECTGRPGQGERHGGGNGWTISGIPCSTTGIGCSSYPLGPRGRRSRISSLNWFADWLSTA